MNEIRVGDLAIEVRRSDRRRTVGLTVERDGRIVLVAPSATSVDRLAGFAREKQGWLYTKLAEQAAMARGGAAKEFVSGEGFAYLGRTFRLLLVERQAVPLALKDGRFRMLRDEVPRGREHFMRWYTVHGTPWMERRVEPWAQRMRVTPETLSVRDLGFRWGSCGRGGRLHFHWATMTLPPPVIDYLIVHELAHLVVPDHGPRFWRTVGRALPEFEARRRWLAEHGGREAMVGSGGARR